MSKIIFPAGIIVDEQTRERTVEFFNTNSPHELEKLANEGICLEIKTEIGSALEHAAWYGAVNAVSKLLALGADPCEYTGGNMDCLQVAAFGASKIGSNHAKIIHELIAYGADIEHRNGDWRTALSITGGSPSHDDNEYDRIEQCRALLSHGANIYATAGMDRLAIEGQPMAERLPELNGWKKQYKAFVAHKFVPENAQDVCHLLAVYPLKDPQGFIDREAHLRQIFSHANWQDVKRKKTAQPPEEIIKKLQKAGSISGVVAESLQSLLDDKIAMGHGRT